MQSIGIVTIKGGSGKTTTAAHLAVAASAAGVRPVMVVDTDKGLEHPQQSLTEWYRERVETLGDANRVELRDVAPRRLAAELGKMRAVAGVVIVDTPGRVDDDVRAVIKAVDLVVIPVQPSPMDIRAARHTLAMVKAAGRPFVFVLTQADRRNGLLEEAENTLRPHGDVAGVVTRRVGYARSMVGGLTIQEVERAPRNTGGLEVAGVWASIARRLFGDGAHSNGTLESLIP